MRIVIVGTVVLNGGDAAILIAEEAMLREATGQALEVSVFDADPIAARKYYPAYDLRQRLQPRSMRRPRRLRGFPRYVMRKVDRWRFLWGVEVWLSRHRSASRLLLGPRERRDLATFAAADVVAFTGGTYLVENYGLDAHSFEMMLARRLRKTVVFLPQSMGPFTTPENRRIMRDGLSGASLILLRDERSRRHVLDLVPHQANVQVAPDVAFGLLPDGAERTNGTTTARRPRTRALQVAVSVRTWPYFKTVKAEDGMRNLRRVVAAAVTELVSSHDASVTFISTCQGTPEYAMDDSSVAQDVCALLDEDVRRHVSVNAAFHDPRELAGELSAFDFTIATRMHVGVLSMIAGTPVLPIAYEFKTHELFANIGLERWLSDIEALDEDAFLPLMNRFIGLLPEVAADTLRAVARQQEELAATTRLLSSVLPGQR